MSRSSSKRFAAAILLSIFLSLIASAVIDKDSVGMVRRGDFPAFYSAAKIVQQGQGSDLYSRHLQQDIENKYWPSLDGNYFAFAYPACFAEYLSPLAQFGPISAKLIFFAIQLCFFAAACAFLRIREILPKERPLESLALIASFAPLFVGVVAGQGAALNLLLLLVVMAFIEKGRCWQHDTVLGILLGLWLFKPQLALIAFVLCSVSCQPLAIFSGWILGMMLTYAMGAFASGPMWPGLWFSQTSNFAASDFATNGFQMISTLAVFGEIAQHFGFLRESGQLIGAGISVLLLLFAILRCARGFERRNVASLLIGPTMLAVGGHVLFYEAGLLLPALIRFTRGKSQLTRLLFVNVFAFTCLMLRESLAVQPLFLLVIAVYAAALFRRSPADEQ